MVKASLLCLAAMVTTAVLTEPLSVATTTGSTTPTTCIFYDGLLWIAVPAGETRTSNCKTCFCDNGGVIECFHVDCIIVMCLDSVPTQDRCCKICPNGPNCKLPSGDLLSADQTTEHNGMICQCPYNIHNSYQGYINDFNAVCIPLNVPSGFALDNSTKRRPKCKGPNCRHQRPWQNQNNNRTRT